MCTCHVLYSRAWDLFGGRWRVEGADKVPGFYLMDGGGSREQAWDFLSYGRCNVLEHSPPEVVVYVTALAASSPSIRSTCAWSFEDAHIPAYNI